MTVSLGRSLLALLVAALLLPALLWLAFPIWIEPVARLALDRAQVELLELESDRPGLSGLRTARLTLRQGASRVEFRDLRLTWRLAGRLSALRIGALQARIDTGTNDAGGAGEDAARSALPDPAALLAALPFEQLEVETADVEALPAGIRFRGSAAASRTRARIDGTLEIPALPRPLAVAGAYDDSDRFRLRLGEAADAPLLDADLRATTTSAAVELAGPVELRAPLLPALVPGAPAIAGTIDLEARVAAGEARLRFLPGTDLEASSDAPHFTARATPSEPWTLDWRDGRLTSSGTPEIAFGVAVSVDAAAIDVDGRLRILALRGTPEKLEVEAIGSLDGRSGTLGGRTEVTLNARLQAPGTLILAAGTGLHDAQLEDSAVPLRVDGLALRLTERTTVDLATLAWTETGVSVEAAGLTLGADRFDLADLRTRAALAGDPDAPRLSLGVEGRGLALGARARLRAGAMIVEVDRAWLDLAPGLLPAELVRRFAPADFEVRRGTVEATGLRWPPQPDGAIELRLAGLGGALADIDVRGLDARIELFPGLEEAPFVIAAGGLRALQTGTWRGDDLELSAEGDLGVWNLAALRAGAVPDTLVVDALDFRAQRLGTDERYVSRLHVTGGARFDARGIRAKLNAAAPTITTAVPATDLVCDVDLEPDAVRLRNCGVALLGGAVEVPAGTFHLGTRSGYLPVAVLGLDLGAVLLLMQDEALEGDGVLDGALPVRIDAGVPFVIDGHVGARPPGGRLRYAADASLLQRLNQPGLSLAMTALGDFRYRELGASVDYLKDGTLALRVRLAGKSPDVERGRPIEFNLNVTQNLPLLLQTLRLSQTIEERIERRLMERNAPR